MDVELNSTQNQNSGNWQKILQRIPTRISKKKNKNFFEIRLCFFSLGQRIPFLVVALYERVEKAVATLSL